MVTRRKALFTIGTAPLLQFSASDAQPGDLYDDYINSTSKIPFVSFLGREGSLNSVGHAFIAVGVRLNATLIVYERFFGLYPENGSLAAVKSVFTPTSGKIDMTWADTSWDTEVNRTIDANQKTKVLAKFNEWNSAAPQYSLLAHGGLNCNGLIAEVARSIGMSAPPNAGSTRPWKYIKALEKLN